MRQVLIRKFRLAWQVLAENGPMALFHRTQKYFAKLIFGRRNIHLLVATADAVAADWTHKAPGETPPSKPPPYTINWILCPPSVGSGGHTTMFRMVRHLERAGHTCRLYSYSTSSTLSIEEQRAILRTAFPPMKAQIYEYARGMDDCDAIIATGWETAYPAFNYQGQARKFYFVQDYEPYFYPVGSQSLLAENTYRFGFHGITAGRWLAEKLRQEYGMACDYFDFGSDADHYRITNTARRKAIMFYARPVTERRGFEFGSLVLTIFNQLHPDFEIHMVGWNVGKYNLPFKFTNHGILKPADLNKLYNRCAAGLVISLTNMSLLPLELLSAGTIPVVNDAANNRLVSDNPYIKYAEATPHAMARALSEIVTMKDLPHHAQAASDSVRKLDWETAGAKVEAAITRELSGKKA